MKSLKEQIISAKLSAGTPVIIINKEPIRIVGGFIAGIEPKKIIMSYENPASPCESYTRANWSLGNRAYFLEKFTELYSDIENLEISSEELEDPKVEQPCLEGRLNAAVGNFVVLSHFKFPLTRVCGFISKLSDKRVELQHESPFYPVDIRYHSSYTTDNIGRADITKGKRSYNLSPFTHYEIIDLEKYLIPQESKDKEKEQKEKSRELK